MRWMLQSTHILQIFASCIICICVLGFVSSLCFIFTVPCVFLMLMPHMEPHILLADFTLFPQGHLSLSSWLLSIYSCRYSSVFLYSTNLAFSPLLLKSSPKLQPEPSLGS